MRQSVPAHPAAKGSAPSAVDGVQERRERPAAAPGAADDGRDARTRQMFEMISARIASKRFSLIEIPANILQIIKVMTNANFSFTEVSSLVTKSPVLTAEFLRTANSVVYSRGQRLTSLQVVLPRLGQKTIRSVLYLHSLKLGLANHPLFRDIATEIVDHSVRTATISDHLGRRYCSDADRAYQAGLLHDIGKLAILRELTRANSTPRSQRSKPIAVTEDCLNSILPELHEPAGEMLAKVWDLDMDITYAIGHHHDLPSPEEGESDTSTEAESGQLEGLRLAAIVNLSDTIAKILARGQELHAVDLLDLPAASCLGIDGNLDAVAHLEGSARLMQ